MKLLPHLRSYLQRPMVRPWALVGPVLVLILCLPMLRPLQQPDSTRWSDEEQLTAATVQAIVEQHSLAIDKSVFAGNPAAIEYEGHRYSPYPPMLAVLLAPVYWVLLRQGLDYSRDLIFVQYLLILIGIALPVSMCVVMTYRLARMFELRRLVRVGLGLATVLASGLITYGVVMNRHAPAAALLLAAITCISHLIVTEHPYRDLLLAALGGFLAALAATVDPPAIALGTILGLVLLAMRWNAATRIGAMILFLAGGAPVILFNIVLLHSTGTPLSAVLTSPHARGMPSLTLSTMAVASVRGETAPAADLEEETESEVAPSAVQVVWGRMARFIGALLESLVGEHGLLSHFPLLVVGLLGAILVLHRNWTAATKSLAALTLFASALLIIAVSLQDPWPGMAYGTPWFAATAPVLLLWAGAWLKRGHRTQSWVVVGVLLTFSMLVGLVGMADPDPRGGYRGYSFAQASLRLLNGPAKPPTTLPTTLPVNP